MACRYGTTVFDTASGGWGGAVYRLSKSGGDLEVLKTLHEATDGQVPLTRLTEGDGGALYGTARDGGAFGYGTMFRLNKDGSGFEVLWAFGAHAEAPKSLTV